MRRSEGRGETRRSDKERGLGEERSKEVGEWRREEKWWGKSDRKRVEGFAVKQQGREILWCESRERSHGREGRRRRRAFNRCAGQERSLELKRFNSPPSLFIRDAERWKACHGAKEVWGRMVVHARPICSALLVHGSYRCISLCRAPSSGSK